MHAHAVLADSSGRVLAGHLVRGTIFAAELYLKELAQADLNRDYDSQTGLKLWAAEQSQGIGH